MDELGLKSASELVALIRTRALSSSELLEIQLRRIEQHNGKLNAVVTLDVERARARARQLDERLARGELTGPLHGLPMTIKDAYETAGIRSTGGAKALEAHVPRRNAVAVQRLIDAGAVIFGKTNVPEYSSDVQTYNEIFGTTRNPHDLERTPGGSSGGAAVSVACGFSALELGSDIGGSIRQPANWTGVYGHKPSYGLIPMRGHIPGPPGVLAEVDLNVPGPLARSAADLWLALDVLAGPDAAHAKAYRLSLPAARRDKLADYRVAVWLDDPSFAVSTEVTRVLERTIAALQNAGARVDLGARPELTLSEIVDTYIGLLNPIIAMGMPKPAIDALAQAVAAPSTEQADGQPLMRFARAAVARHIDWLRLNE
ncbi:MAG: amidase family protein, partial [Polyangiales bacterium]